MTEMRRDGKLSPWADITLVLLQALQRNIGNITAAKCGRWSRLMQAYFPRCVKNERMLYL